MRSARSMTCSPDVSSSSRVRGKRESSDVSARPPRALSGCYTYAKRVHSISGPGKFGGVKSMESFVNSLKRKSGLPLAAALLAAAAISPAGAAGWEPTKPVEIVVAAGAGGASDQMARMMQAAIQKNNLMKQPMVVTLKGGASGAEALMYMKSSPGDPH